jgi:transcriptional regulator with XRE-family HTH domain
MILVVVVYTMKAVAHTLRQLREALGKDQRQMASLAGCTRHTIESVEQHRLKLSPRLAYKISEATGVDYAWLLANDSSLPMVNRVGEPYALDDFEFAQDSDLPPLQFHWISPEMEVGVAYDMLMQALAAARRRNAVPQFQKRLADFLRREVGHFREIEDAVYGGHRRDGKGILFPRSVEPFKRGRVRFREAIAAISAREKTLQADRPKVSKK